MKRFIAILLVTFSSITTVNAASLCSYQEQNTINQKAANIKVSYEILTEKEPSENDPNLVFDVDYFNISITNITDDFYIRIKNDYNNQTQNFSSSDAKDGIITFKWSYSAEVTNFTIDIYTSNKTSCPNEVYKTIYLTTPRFNTYSQTDFCVENSDLQYCQKYVTFKEIEYNDFDKRVEKFKNDKKNNDKNEEEDNKSKNNKILEFFDKYKWTILGSSVIIGAGIFIIVINMKKGKQRDLGL